MYGFKLKEDEWFKEGFHKLLSLVRMYDFKLEGG